MYMCIVCDSVNYHSWVDNIKIFTESTANSLYPLLPFFDASLCWMATEMRGTEMRGLCKWRRSCGSRMRILIQISGSAYWRLFCACRIVGGMRSSDLLPFYYVSQKYPLGVFYNFKAAWTNLRNSWHPDSPSFYTCIISHLTLVVFCITREYISNWICTLFFSGWGGGALKRSRMMRPTDNNEFREISRTD